MEVNGSTSDGYHTFDELYEHRITLFIALCRERCKWPTGDSAGQREAWRSKMHADGTMFDGWFVMGLRYGLGEQITYHLPLTRWGETNFASTLERAPKFDGHTPADVLERLKRL